jgi:purine-nucleoside phosphorylase
MLEALKQTVDFIQSKINRKPEVGIILGTGLGKLATVIEDAEVLSYEDIPHFPVSTVESHSGKLIFGTLEGKNVVVMQGRFHYYEGYDLKQVTYPVRVMKPLGIEKLFISNAAGGINPEHEMSDLMVINDHINLLPENPLRGKNEDRLGPRFPDMYEVYDPGMISQALEIAKEHKLRVHTGVYASVAGPNLETNAEYRYMGIIGADAVGMSTVPEAIVAKHMDLPVFAVSVVTDLCSPGRIKKVSLADVIEAATNAERSLEILVRGLLRRI